MNRSATAAAVAAIAGVYIFAPAVASAQPASPQPIVARAASVAGSALLTPAAGGPAFALTAGFTLTFADRIDTRGGGRVVIDLSDGSVMVVQPGTLLTIKNFAAAESLRELFEITIGIVRVKINHFVGRPNPYRMNSPTASIAVRGTEFNITVAESGETSVDVFDGAVEVSSLADPERKVLVEGGHGVLVRPGDDFRMYSLQGAALMARQGDGPDRGDRHEAPPSAGNGPGPSRNPGGAGPQPQPSEPPSQLGALHGGGPEGGESARKPMQPRAATPAPIEDAQPKVQPLVSSAYDRYLGVLTGAGHLPFGARYGAFADAYADTLENPAYATRFSSRTEGRFLIAPMFGGGAQAAGTPVSAFSISPQASMYSPFAGGRFVAGGSFTMYRAGAFPLASAGSRVASADTQFLTGTGTLAARFSSVDSIGIGFERVNGSGDDGPGGTTSIGETRLTVGYSRDLSPKHKIGVDYRTGWIDANNAQTAGGRLASGRSNEIGLRLRGAISPRLLYGVSAAWSASGLDQRFASGIDTLSTRRVLVSVGGAYIVDRSTVLNADVTFARASSSAALDRAASVHVAIQRELTRKLFADASFMSVSRSWIGSGDVFARMLAATLYPNGGRFSEFSAGWRITPAVTAQYIFATDYGITSGLHAVVVRYTWRRSGD